MADLRCPMCGKPNSDELEKCAFCGARLKPLLASSPDNRPPILLSGEPAPPKVASHPRGTAPFSDSASIRSDEVPTRKTVEANPEAEQSLPDWLRELRDQPSYTPSPTEPGDPFVGDGWPVPFEMESPAQAIEEKLPDWQANRDTDKYKEEKGQGWLADQTEQPAVMMGQAESQEASIPLEEAEWLVRLNQEQKERATQSASSPPPFSPESMPEVSSLLKGLPDWQSTLKSEPASAKPALTEDTSEKAKPPEETLGLAEQIQPERKQEPIEAPVPPPTPAEELPEWLIRLQAGSKAPTRELPHIDVPFEESPDWLAKLQASAFTEVKKPPVTEIAIEPPFAEKEPLIAPPEIVGPPSGEEKPSPVPTQAEGMPDRLARVPPIVAEETVVQATSIPIPEFVPPLSEEPDQWIKVDTETVTGDERLPTPAISTPQEGGTFGKAETPLPDWLAEFGEAATASVPEESTALAGMPEANLLRETPDWLPALKPEEGEKKTSVESSEGARIAPVELPSWVQALRPVEAVLAEGKAGEKETKEESPIGGPLSGLSGVLPLIPGQGPLRIPKSKTGKLTVTEGQQLQKERLERLIAAERQPRPLTGQARSSSERLSRQVIGLLLILAVGLSLAAGNHIAPAAVYPSELSPTRELISGLPANPPVLLVFDYEPALSSELEAAASPVVEHLLFKGPRLAILSTSLTGSILATNFMKNTTPLAEYVNLGYLAGGPAGVRGFIENPASAAAMTIEGVPAWQTPILRGIQKISDFATIIILTDAADDARAWVEQAHPYLADIPMIMVVSAQAEPMVRPYYDSGQVKGLVIGLVGGKAYEQANEQAFQGTGMAPRYWDAFSVGILLVEVFIVVGGVWGIMATRRSRQDKVKEGA